MAKVVATKEKTAKKPTGGAKKTSKYNMFMKTELAKVKAANKELSHKEAFKKAASNWATSPDNPKNQK